MVVKLNCTTGDYYAAQGVAPCNDIGNSVKFRTFDGTEVSSSASITRGYKADLIPVMDLDLTVVVVFIVNGTYVGGGGAGAYGGDATTSNAGGGGGSFWLYKRKCEYHKFIARW